MPYGFGDLSPSWRHRTSRGDVGLAATECALGTVTAFAGQFA
jgi:hypothetical protein